MLLNRNVITCLHTLIFYLICSSCVIKADTIANKTSQPQQLTENQANIITECKNKPTIERSEVLAISPDGKIIASKSFSNIQFWDIATGKLIRTLKDDKNGQSLRLSISKNNKNIIISSQNQRTITIKDIVTGEVIQNIQDDSKVANQSSETYFDNFIQSPDGKKIFAVSVQNIFSGYNKQTSEKEFYNIFTIKVWDIATGKYIKTLATGRNQAVNLIFNGSNIILSPDEKNLITYLDDNLIFFDVQTELETLRIPRKTMMLGGYLNAFAVSRDAKVIIVADDINSTITWWNLINSKVIHQVRNAHSINGTIDNFLISPNNKILVSNSNQDKTIKLWNMTSHKNIYSFKEQENRDLLMTANGNLIFISWNEIGRKSFQSIMKLDINSGKINRIACNVYNYSS
jgi:WD40 repeat protein